MLADLRRIPVQAADDDQLEALALELAGLGDHDRRRGRQPRVGSGQLGGVGDGGDVADEVAGRGAGLAAGPLGGAVGERREIDEPLRGLGRRLEEPLTANPDPLDQPPDEDVGPQIVDRPGRGAVKAQEGGDLVAGLGAHLRTLERSLECRDHVELAAPRDRRAAGKVGGAKLDRRPGQGADHRRRV